MKRIPILCLTLLLILSLASCGYISPDAAMEGVGIGHSAQPRIEADGVYFYYWTVAENLSDPGEYGDWIYNVIPVERTGVGLWHPITRPDSYPLYAAGTEEMVGALYVYELDGTNHNFFIPYFEGNDPDPVTLPAALPADYNTVTVDGQELELTHHAYFTTETEVHELTVGDVTLTRDRP